MRSKTEDFFYQESRIIPNSFTIELGKRIRSARLEKKMSQAELAELTYFKQASISRIESGTKAISAEDILYLSAALDKPIIFFFPERFAEELGKTELSALEHELIILVRQLDPSDLRKLIAQARALVEFRE